jgi:hypothetical protein
MNICDVLPGTTEMHMPQLQASVGICAAIFLIASEARAGPVTEGTGRIILGQAAAPTFCPEVEIPVCGTKDGRRVRYGNECKAKRDGATNITPGGCPN